jgi:hypothetical protein
MTLRLPPLVPLDDEVIERNELAHASLAAALDGSDEHIRGLFRAVQRRCILEAAATTGPIWANRKSQVIVARRRLLSKRHRVRVAGVGDAIRHLDTRVTMVELGVLDHVVNAETPYVVNAYAEGRQPQGQETNAGSIRSSSLTFLDDHAVYEPPVPEECREMLSAAVEVVRSAPVAPITSAAWIALAMFAIHPFLDGNGRSARLLFHATHSASLPGRVDWGSIEMWALDRELYITEIQRSVGHVAKGELDLIDPMPFFDFVAKSSIDGAERCKKRLAALESMFDRLSEKLGPDAALVATFVWSERNVRYAELSELPMDPIEARAIANDLVTEGVLERAARRGLNPNF